LGVVRHEICVTKLSAPKTPLPSLKMPDSGKVIDACMDLEKFKVVAELLIQKKGVGTQP